MCAEITRDVWGILMSEYDPDGERIRLKCFLQLGVMPNGEGGIVPVKIAPVTQELAESTIEEIEASQPDLPETDGEALDSDPGLDGP